MGPSMWSLELPWRTFEFVDSHLTIFFKKKLISHTFGVVLKVLITLF